MTRFTGHALCPQPVVAGPHRFFAALSGTKYLRKRNYNPPATPRRYPFLLGRLYSTACLSGSLLVYALSNPSSVNSSVSPDLLHVVHISSSYQFEDG
jgi:hypothetical protein